MRSGATNRTMIDFGSAERDSGRTLSCCRSPTDSGPASWYPEVYFNSRPACQASLISCARSRGRTITVFGVLTIAPGRPQIPRPATAHCSGPFSPSLDRRRSAGLRTSAPKVAPANPSQIGNRGSSGGPPSAVTPAGRGHTSSDPALRPYISGHRHVSVVPVMETRPIRIIRSSSTHGLKRDQRRKPIMPWRPAEPCRPFYSAAHHSWLIEASSRGPGCQLRMKAPGRRRPRSVGD